MLLFVYVDGDFILGLDRVAFGFHFDLRLMSVDVHFDLYVNVDFGLLNVRLMPIVMFEFDFGF